MPTFQEVSDWIRRSEVGRSAEVESPFGRRRVLYADLTASGRALAFVESRMARALPLYANVHSGWSTTGRATTALREAARGMVANAVGAGPDDVVLFVGSGATAAVNKLVGLLGLRIPEPLEREYHLASTIPPERRPVVLAGPYEHHSNELPWLESIADLVEVELSADGTIDLDDLRQKAHAYRERPLCIGAISAASNVTGVITDIRAVCRVLHGEGALACIDYAAAGPYVPIDMHPGDEAARVDALFLSTHKFMGGPGASGILVANRSLFRSRVPERPGGGTVDYVGPGSADRHGRAGVADRDHDGGSGPATAGLNVDYVLRLTDREEGGTPNILGDVRAGCAMAVKELAGPERLLAHEVALGEQVVRRLRAHPRLRLLGPTSGTRLPIVSFNVEGLHHEFVSVLLDHLFGIQTRAGCSCAGPYGHRLLGIDDRTSRRYRRLIQEGVLGVKPGWVRFSVPYYASRADVEFLLTAVETVADIGRAFVPLYEFSWRDASWRWPGSTPPVRSSLLAELAELWRSGDSAAASEPTLDEDELVRDRTRYLEEARSRAEELEVRWRQTPPAWNRPTGRGELDDLVWFRYVETVGL